MKIIVIGGGVMGLSCAWRLAQRGTHVTLFDARASHQNASGSALGALWPASPLARGPFQILHRHSLWQFESFIRELEDFTETHIPFQRLGRIELLNSPKAFARAEQEAATARSEWPEVVLRLPVMEALSPPSVHELLPELAAQHHGAILCRATAQVHVPSLLDTLVLACQRAGVQLCFNTPLTTLPAEVATLVTAGAWTSKLLPELSITPAKGQGVALRRPMGFRLAHIVKSGPTYIVPWEEELLVGSTTEPEAGFDEAPTAVAREDLLSRAAALFPELAHAQVLRHFAGLRPDAPSHRPLMGALPNRPNTYIAAGHFKTGVALAPLVSKLMTTLILDRTLPPELAPFIPA